MNVTESSSESKEIVELVSLPTNGRARHPRTGHAENLAGRRFGRYTCISFSYRGPTGKYFWNCKCDCGTERVVRGQCLTSGKTKSCGCGPTDSRRKHNQTWKGEDGKTRVTKEWRAWSKIKERCFNPNTKGYKNYGGRGITMAPEWINDAAAFIAHIGPAPSSAHSVERRRVDGNYEPGNVCWATSHEQCRNRRNNTWVEINGERLTLTDACLAYGLPMGMVQWQRKKGHTFQEIVDMKKATRVRGGLI
jgi:hypothetical protein